MSQYAKGYRLSLSDGRHWCITSNDGLQHADKMAAMMELASCEVNSSPKLVFSSTENADSVKAELSDYALPVLSHVDGAGEWTACDHKITLTWQHSHIADVVCEIRDGAKDYASMLFSCQPMFQRSMSLGGLPFHAAFAELDGRGVLLAAPSGTGKSTCCRRFPDYWKPLCDDETLVVLDEHKQYRAHPFPTWSEYLWKPSGRTWNVEYSAPVSGIFFLEQSDTDKVIPIGEGQAAVLMSGAAIHVWKRLSIGMDAEQQNRLRLDMFHNACKMAKAIPAFRLCASLHGRFWEEIEKTIQ